MQLSQDTNSRIVIKIGSSTLTTSASSIDYAYMRDLASQIATLKSQGFDVIIVSSGAIACGLEALGVDVRPSDMPSLQAAASVGQSKLTNAYDEAFAKHDILTSLVLLTRRDTADREAYLHARDTLLRLLEMGVVPIVNENDTVSVEQIRFGDNDTLAALVACLIEADLLVILSDIDGLYDKNPNDFADAKLLSIVDHIDASVLDACGGPGSSAGSGGMVTKIQAARVLMAAGIDMAIVNGKSDSAILRAVKHDGLGTRFVANVAEHDITPKKLWLALGDSARGGVMIDAGAKRALISNGASLLVVGITDVQGSFERDDIIDVLDENDFVIARGRVAFSSDELALAIGKSKDSLESNRLLAHLAQSPVIHRDELMIF